MELLTRRFILILFGLILVVTVANTGYQRINSSDIPPNQSPPFLNADSSWADSLMDQMSLNEKIGQMMMIQAYSDQGEAYAKDLIKIINRYKPGGIIFFKGEPVSQARISNRLQTSSEIPLLLAMDAEWGLGMRLDNVISYPRQMMLGAIRDNDIIYRLGKDMAEQLKDMGIHMNFAPVADVNNNPDNPVINTRSFGEDKYNVSEKVTAVFQGMQDQKVLVTAKHFPGHGDTNVDSHHALPVIRHSSSRLDSVELFPFRNAIRNGITGIMVAHLNVLAIDSRANRPTTLSEYAIDSLLIKEMQFKGLVVSDALNMKGVSDFFDAGELEVEAIKAGTDILLMPQNVNKVIASVKKAIRHGELTEERIDHSCRKILLAKKWVGLDTIQHIDIKGLEEKLNSRKYLALQQEIVENALTLVKNNNDLIPLTGLERMKLATVNLGTDNPSVFTEYIDKYKTAGHFFFKNPSDITADSALNNELIKYNTLIINLYYTRSFGNNFDIPEEAVRFLDKLHFDGEVILNLFGYPYALDVLGDLNFTDAILVSYTNQYLNQKIAAQAIFGGTSLSGKLPVSTKNYRAGSGITTRGGVRLKYGYPEHAKMNYDTLTMIDQIVENAIRNKAMPGCQVLIAKNGEVVWNKSYGYHTYRKRRAVNNDDLYDLASVTKIASTIPSFMRLLDQGRFSIDSTLGTYVHDLDTSAKAKMQIRDILTHQAGFEAWIPFYFSTLETLDTSETLFSTNFSYTYPYKMGPGAYANRNILHKDSVYDIEYSPEFPLNVAENLYLRADYADSVYYHIRTSPQGDKEYKYSDLGYYYFYKMVEDISDTLFYPFNWYNFYAPLGAETLGFLPLRRFPADRIVPTENDRIFRNQLIRGHVHDPGAAMLGGVCGHAGLFSNANDLAKLMQMYLNKGEYGGLRFIDSSTVTEFTRCQYCEFENRRALGFDRPITDEEDAGPACNSASELSYGHSGFTGTLAWNDPKYNLVYIFLSNRIHPNQSNTRLISMNVRTEIQQVIYNSFLPPQADTLGQGIDY